MKKAAAILLFCLLSGCGYDRFGEMERGAIPVSALTPNCDISTLRENYFGTPVVVPDDIVIEGYVAANDLSGNWFRSFVIEDGTGGIEVRAGISDVHILFQRGRRVSVSVRGLAMGSYNGVLQLGRKINHYSDWRVEEFGARPLLERYVGRDTVFCDVIPRTAGIGELDPKEAGRLVRVGPVELLDSDAPGITWAGAGSAGQSPSTGAHRFCDADGNTIDVITSGYASFARAPVPRGKVWLTGVLLYGKFDGGSERFGIRLRDLDDVEAD